MTSVDIGDRPGSSGSRTIINHDPPPISPFAFDVRAVAAADTVLTKLEYAERGEGATPPPSLFDYFSTNVDPASCIGQLIAFCFITGYL
jgi:hypothetical protein